MREARMTLAEPVAALKPGAPPPRAGLERVVPPGAGRVSSSPVLI
jgi:hypothetical protein